MIVVKYLTGQFFFLTVNFGDVHAFSHRDCSGVKGLRSQDPRGGSDFLAPSQPRGHFLASGGPFLRSVAAQKSQLSSASFWQGLHFPDFIVNVTVLGARAARDFFKDFGIQAPENPKFSPACRGMKAWSLKSGSFLSPLAGLQAVPIS